MTQYAIITDLNRCVGCLACTVACKAVNNVPVGAFWIKTLRVGPNPIEGGSGDWPDVEMYFLPIQCQHCADPECVKVCPTEALALPADATAENTLLGLAVIDEAQCLAFRDTGCRYCYDACPYEAIELTGEGANPHVSVLADKCNGCGACESVCVSLKAGSIVSGAQERAIVVKPIESAE